MDFIPKRASSSDLSKLPPQTLNSSVLSRSALADPPDASGLLVEGGTPILFKPFSSLWLLRVVLLFSLIPEHRQG